MKKLTICCAVLMLAVGCGDDGTVDPVDAGRTDSGGGDVDSGPDEEDSGTGEDSGPGDDAGGDTDAGPEPDAGPVVPATCATYCTTIMDACTDGNAQYADMASCLGSCMAFEAGEPGAAAGNSLECRAYHAGAASGDPATHCTHAGPGGDSLCGTNCEGFCTIAQDRCTGPNSQFTTEAECLTTCAAFPATTPYNTGETSGNTLACRLYHLTVAATNMAQANTHCDHIALVSSTCGAP